MTEKTQPIQTGSLGEATKTSATTPNTPAHTPLPCPFCGSDHLTVCEIVGRGYTIECEGCHIEGPLAKDGPSLLERWNTRAALSQAGGASE